MTNTIERKEQYLDIIRDLVIHGEHVRTAAMAQRLQWEDRSLQAALDDLVHGGMIRRIDNYICFTPQGQRAARDMLERYDSLQHYLETQAGLEPYAALGAICALEQVLDYGQLETLALSCSA